MTRRTLTVLVRAGLLLAIAACASACSRNGAMPTLPTGPSAQENVPLTGTARLWRGVLALSCTGQQFLCTKSADFALRLVGNGSRALGTIQMQFPWANVPTALDVEGFAPPGDVLVLTGTQMIPRSGGSDLSVSLELSLKLKIGSSVDGAMSFTYTDDGVSTKVGGNIAFARELMTTSPGPFEGQWQGAMVRTSCNGTCDEQTRVMTTSMLLSQSGSMVTGTSGSGTATGKTLTLDFSLPPNPSCHPLSEADIYCRFSSHSDLVVDDLERLKGTYTVDTDVFPEYGPRRTYSATFQLLGVSRWP